MLETPPLAHGSARYDCATQAAVRTARLADFIAGDENRAAVAAVEWLLEDGSLSKDAASPTSGPVVLHGPSGVGKSLLVRGLLDAWSAQRPDEAIEFLTGNEWNEAYVAAVDANRIQDFRRRFRECDLLVIDDLHRLGPKSAAQMELLATLDALNQRGTAVAVTLNHAPAKTEDFPTALVARLQGGTVVEVAPAAVMTRRAILGEAVCRRGWTVEIAALELLAADRSRNVPEILGLLIQWYQKAAAEGTLLSAAFARKQLGHPAGTVAPSLRTIAEQTARRFGLTVADLKSESRRRTIVSARDTAVLLMRRLTKKSLQEIGEYFGGRDHTTVMHSCRKAEAALDVDPEARTLFAELQQAVERA